nr:N-acetylmuramic acid 6-phosphate etherase [Olsenella sp. Marseille-P4559]
MSTVLPNLGCLLTEQRNPDTMELDTFTPLQIVEAMNREDRRAVDAVHAVLPQVAQAITWATQSLSAGGRILYVGAGTSGRLGLLDAVECPPTFGVSPDVVVGIIAGGKNAFIKAREGAEDSEESGEEDLRDKSLCSKDIVIGLAASGRTPYVVGALRFARSLGCKTVSIACNPNSEISSESDLAIEVITGPEVLTGSTRLKAGTTQKLILNMISTGSMVGIGKAYQNLMVDVQQNNEKLRARAQGIVCEACGCTPNVASEKLDEANGNAKLAITMLLLNCDAGAARAALREAKGHVRQAAKNVSPERQLA